MVYNRSGNPASDPRNLFKFGGIRLIKVDDSDPAGISLKYHMVQSLVLLISGWYLEGPVFTAMRIYG